MSIGSYNLRLLESYDRARMAFELDKFRALLRKEREQRVGGRDRLAEKADVAASTVQNAEMGPDVPGIDTVARLIEAMPNLTLSDFFLQLEQKNRVQGSSVTYSVKPIGDKRTASTPTGIGGGSDGGPIPADIRAALARFFFDSAHRLTLELEAERATDRAHRESRRPRRRKS